MPGLDLNDLVRDHIQTVGQGFSCELARKVAAAALREVANDIGVLIHEEQAWEEKLRWTDDDRAQGLVSAKISLLQKLAFGFRLKANSVEEEKTW